MFLYHYPTTVVVLDDDADFLSSLRLRFHDDPLLATFTDPEAAIAHVRLQHQALPPIEKFLSSHQDSLTSTEEHRDRLIRFRSAAVAEIMSDRGRFGHVSVLIADYDMPVLNGIQVCRAVANLPIRKLLLTGKAGVDVGVRALNDGTIDGYFAKQDRTLSSTLRSAIQRQRHLYFERLTQPLRTAMEFDEMEFLADPAVEETTAGLMQAMAIVEHFVTCDPPGIILRRRDGSAFWLLIADDLSISSHADLAQDLGAPQPLIDLLRNRKGMALFPSPGGFYTTEFATNWVDYVRPARRIVGAKAWCYAMFDWAPEQRERATSLDMYLAD